MRISTQVGNTFVPFDEHFNKHILFHSNGFTADIAYTGAARWMAHGQAINVYDVISASVARSAQASLALAPLTINLVKDVSSALGQASFLNATTTIDLELHIIGYHQQIPWPLISVISTFRKEPPWPDAPGEPQWVYRFPGVSIFLKATEQPLVVLGGMDTQVTTNERLRLLTAVTNGADAFNVARLSAKLIERVAKRTSAVGPTSVAVLLPTRGFVDTNLWEKGTNGFTAFMPRMVFENGTMWGVVRDRPVTVHAVDSREQRLSRFVTDERGQISCLRQLLFALGSLRLLICIEYIRFSGGQPGKGFS